jgi:hypothetical protein
MGNRVSIQAAALRNPLSKHGQLSAIILAIFGATFVIFHAARSAAANARSSTLQTPQAARSGEASADRTKLAEGEYATYEQSNDGAVGPFGEQIYNLDETWTLWRAGKDGYQVEGVRKFESPKNETHADRFLVDLSRDLTVTRAQEFTKLKWIENSGPLTCEFLPNELHCSSGGADPKHAIELHTPLNDPYGLLWPISPFSLSGITREVERDPVRPTQIDLVSIEQPSQANPVEPTILSGPIQYVGEDSIKAAGKNWRALKFSLKVPLHPEYLIWTSSKGLLLAVAIEHQHKNWREEGMRLERFQSWGDF